MSEWTQVTRKHADESATEFGQWVHDELPRDFNYIDDDFRPGRAYTRARSTGIMRICEHKFPGQTLTAAEREDLVVWAGLLELGKQNRLLEAGSCVYVITCDVPPTSGADVYIVWPESRSTSWRLSGETLSNLVRCRPVSRSEQLAA